MEMTRRNAAAAVGVAVATGLGILTKEAVAEGRCPNIHKAIGALEVAKGDLEHAAHDFCGHRAEAVEAVNRALEQLRRAEECDKCK